MLVVACQQVALWLMSHGGKQVRGSENCGWFVCSRQFPVTEDNSPLKEDLSTKVGRDGVRLRPSIWLNGSKEAASL